MKKPFVMNPKFIRPFIAILFISASFFLASAQMKKTASLEIKIMDCRSQRLEYLSKLTIIKDDKIIKELEPKHNYTQTVTDLELGTYYLAYTSIFHKPETLKVNVTSYQEYQVELCVNFIGNPPATFQPVIDRLQEKESYSIIMSSQGCFHFTNDTLIINKENGVFKAKMKLKTKTLDADNIKAVRQFEFELDNITTELLGCTTTDSYTILYKGEKKHVDDGGCDWNGDYYLMKNLFGENK
jgi:hypothetical protein